MLKYTNWNPITHHPESTDPRSDGRTSAPGADQGPVSLSAKVCEEKLRYAAYNCVAIDTDMSPWEE